MNKKTKIDRHFFGLGQQYLDVQDLIEIQKKSYDRFLQLDTDPDSREDWGLQSAFLSVFPIEDYNGNIRIDFLEYSLGDPKYNEREAIERGMTHAAPLKIKVRIAILEKNKESDRPKSFVATHVQDSVIKTLREQEIYLGDLPLMTTKGTFIINGTERVVVSQLHRSPGVFFSHDKTKTRVAGTPLFTSRIIPYRGSWVDFEYDPKDNLFVRIDRKKKFPATVMLKALGLTASEIIREYYPTESLFIEPGTPQIVAFYPLVPGEPLVFQLKDQEGPVFREETLPSDSAELNRVLRERSDLTIQYHNSETGTDLLITNVKVHTDAKNTGLFIPLDSIVKGTKKTEYASPELTKLIEKLNDGLNHRSSFFSSELMNAKSLLSLFESHSKVNESLLQGSIPFHAKTKEFSVYQPMTVFRCTELSVDASIPFRIVSRSAKEEGDRTRFVDETLVNERDPLSKENIKLLLKTKHIGTIHHRNKRFYPVTLRESANSNNTYLLLEALPEKEIDEYYSAEEILDPTDFTKSVVIATQPLGNKDLDKNKKPVLLQLFEKGIQKIEAYVVPHNQRGRAVIHQTLAGDKVSSVENERSYFLKFMLSKGLAGEQLAMALANRFLPYEEIVVQSKKRRFYARVGAKSTFRLISGDGEVLLTEGAVVTQEIVSSVKSLSQAIVVRGKNDEVSVSASTETDNLGDKIVFTSKEPVKPEELLSKVLLFPLGETRKGHPLRSAGEQVEFEDIDLAKKAKLEFLPIVSVTSIKMGELFWELVDLGQHPYRVESDPAVIEIYKKIRPGEVPHVETARQFFEQTFFNTKRYDLSSVGRLKINSKLGVKENLNNRLLTKNDVVEVIRYMVGLLENKGEVDDIDHLGNRRVRSVGELLENQFRVGLVRMERAIKERLNLGDPDAVISTDLINAKPVSAIIKEFFGSSQLSQFMDQTNPLAEVTHKRRLSALGPGGLTRERAGFEVRDVHASHYGRICPIETPEGPNIGLITSLATFARVNDFGFIESPVRKVEDGKVLPEIIYLSAMDGDKFIIAQANTPIDEKGRFIESHITARHKGDFVSVPVDKVQFIDVSPQQIVSVATAMIPFLEHNDANRALMGSNMQRQAVPLLRASAPIVGTGMERIVARDSGYVIYAEGDGQITNVDGSKIVLKYQGEEKPKEYNLIKFQRSNQNTCLNQKSLLPVGTKVKKGDVIADGPSTDRGDLAMGQNVLVAFMPWGGYNFEDAILVSERLIRDDMFTSIHIEEFELEARETKQGKEEITRDIPNLSEESLRNLDESGIIRIGAEVKPGDILVGKVTPKAETQLTPEERLLRAIFGDKSANWKDASLTVPAGIEGIVVDVRILSRKGVEREELQAPLSNQDVTVLTKSYQDDLRELESSKILKIRKFLIGKVIKEDILDSETGDVLLKKKRRLTQEILDKLNDLSIITLSDPKEQDELLSIERETKEKVESIQLRHDERIGRLKRGDELPPGVLKLVKVYIAMKRKLSVGDKMAGRHGNKGVVSRILPMEDMPFLPDGTPVDIVLNPLGVPSRMNVGQILETHLGWAGKVLNVHFASPVFDGASESEIKEQLRRANLPETGQTILFDGKTGDSFERPVTVGVMYMLKLHHLVDDKIHARSIGPYSLVTQQPLGGKAQFGGQRLGEMEVWALQAYGAASTLQEFLTVKSDDVSGRSRMYEAIVRGENYLEPGLPESFNVLIKELQSLALDIELLKTKEK
uniref:DNA-directed RNA polymerase subunit beta n=1 Tax=Leptospirillum ferriphilum TaxID=178606 RepID=A0A7C3LXA2_9BACT